MTLAIRSLSAALLLAAGAASGNAQPAALATGAASSAIADGKAVVNGVRYHYLLARGRGPTVVLLHGWGSTSHMWRFVMPRLVAAGYTVLAPDQVSDALLAFLKSGG
jgi:pimeloyl-ACP methyl ester carboxylesterase